MASEKHRGLIQSVLTLILVSLVAIASLGVYSFFSEQFQIFFGLSKGLADGLSLFLFSVVLGAVAVVGYQLIILNFVKMFEDVKLSLINMILGAFTFLIVSALLFSSALSLPLTPFIKNTLSSSLFINNLTVSLQSLESTQRRLVTMPNNNLINFITVSPKTEDKIEIPTNGKFVANNERINEVKEGVNQLRKSMNVIELSLDGDSSIVAQNLAQLMSQNGILSRDQISGSTPYDILAGYRIKYTMAYYIPLYAQNVSLGLNGLSQVPDYKRELISPSYTNIGIGVVDLEEQGLVISLILTN